MSSIARQLSGTPHSTRAQVETDSTRRLVRLLEQVDGLLTRLSDAEYLLGGLAIRHCARASVKRAKPCALLGDSPNRFTRTASGAGGVWAFVVGPQRSTCSGHACGGPLGDRRHGGRNVAATSTVGGADRAGTRDLAAAHGRAAGAPAVASHDSHHGHAAIRGRNRPRLGSRICAAGHEHRTDQLRPRRCTRVAGNGAPCPGGGRMCRHDMSGGNGSSRAEAADRAPGAGTAGHQTTSAQRRSRSGGRPGAGVADVD